MDLSLRRKSMERLDDPSSPLLITNPHSRPKEFSSMIPSLPFPHTSTTPNFPLSTFSFAFFRRRCKYTILLLCHETLPLSLHLSESCIPLCHFVYNRC
ncbi:hypothetical protein K435DRAFT_111882 [Dendrothele bispora CBS 962.96]|uniref:Uncharacterized protein n=1 Tax=Dendrothele bispora (strain CBS 962.96) TaxID=1314807 RepID=A0A4S8M1C4_DENBC|nr:hypothetical protein K435DRAFT_111882 [Dendrothele bispora CBS 962.96]